MTKQQVIQTLGHPTQISVEQNVEHLQYEWDKFGDDPYGGA
jgi:hypothetical protein